MCSYKIYLKNSLFLKLKFDLFCRCDLKIRGFSDKSELTEILLANVRILFEFIQKHETLVISRLLFFRINPLKFEKHLLLKLPYIGIIKKNSGFRGHDGQKKQKRQFSTNMFGQSRGSAVIRRSLMRFLQNIVVLTKEGSLFMPSVHSRQCNSGQ